FFFFLFVDLLLPVYTYKSYITNNDSKKYFESKRNSDNEFSWYVEFFEKALGNETLVKMKPVNIDINNLLLAVTDPQLYSIQTDLQHSFPFSRSIHNWCQQQLSKHSKSPDNHPGSDATKLEQIPIGNDDLTQWDMDYSLQIIHEYVMDLVRYDFSWCLHTQDEQIILRNVIVSIALLLCGKLSIATIEVTIRHFRQIIFHYAYLISIASRLSSEIPDVEEDILKNQPGSWFVQMTQALWKSIPIGASFTTNDSIMFFPKSISIVLNFLSKHLQKESANLMNELSQTAREIEIQRLGIIYLETDEFVDEEEHLIEYGLLENKTSVYRVLKTPQKYSDFIQDLLATIKRVEGIEENADRRNVYISILPKLYSQINNRPIFKMQILKEMVLHGHLDNNISLYSEEAVLLGRCLELMILNEEIEENDERWRQLCDEKDPSDLNCVVQIATVKAKLARLIAILVDADIDLSHIEGNQTLFKTLEKINKLLSDFNSCHIQYAHALHVWFLKQFHVWKGILRMELLFAHPMVRRKYPVFSTSSPIRVFALLHERTLNDHSFDPWAHFVHNPQQNQTLSTGFSLYNSIAWIESLTSLSKDKKLSFKSISDITGSTVASLRCHFLQILADMEDNPFKLLQNKSELFFPDSTWCGITANEPSKVYYCMNHHPLLINGSEDLLKQVKCQVNGCKASVSDIDLKTFSRPTIASTTNNVSFVLTRYYTFPKKMEPDTMRPIIFVLLRLLYHLLLLARNEEHSKDREKIRQLVKQPNASDVTKFLWDKTKRDFKRLQVLTNLDEELLCIAIHLWMTDFSEKFKKWNCHESSNYSLQKINEFEEALDKEYSIFFLIARLKLICEIEETKEVDERHETIYIERLFLEVQTLSWRDLFHVFTANPSLANDYPLIAQLLNWDWGIWYLQYLPDIAHLIKYIHKKYSRQLMPDELYRIQEDEIFEQTHLYKKSKNSFVSCWNYFALNHQQLQQDFKNLPMDQVCIIDSNVNNLQFNIYQIIRHLEYQHNEFLKTFEQSEHPHIQIFEKKEDRLSQHHWKYFFDITRYDILCFDKEALNAIIQRRSTPILEYGQSDKSKYFDLAAIENDIYHTFVHGRQQVTFIIPLFEYRNELDIRNCITIIETKYKDFKYAQFQSFWDNLRLSVASPLQKQKALEMINDAIVHLFQKSNTINIDIELTNLFKNLQFEKKDWILFDRINDFNDNKTNKLCIKHIGILWRQLRNLVQLEQLDESSILPFVLNNYRQPLTNEIKIQLKEFVNKTLLGTRTDILRAWREIAYKQGQIKRDSNTKLGFFLEQYVSKNQLEYFPSHLLTWNYCAFAYQYAYQCIHQEWKKHDQKLVHPTWIMKFWAKMPF
ncbi:hypothetical protein RFI_29499, partial [Reticulomyxa filosa]